MEYGALLDEERCALMWLMTALALDSEMKPVICPYGAAVAWQRRPYGNKVQPESS